MTSNERNYSFNGLCLTGEVLQRLDINCINWGGGLPPLKVTTKTIINLLVHSNYVTVAGGIGGVLHHISYNFQDDSCIEMSKRTNEYTDPELDTQAKEVINETDASSVIIE